MMIAVNQVVVTAPALRTDVATACSSFDHLGLTDEQCRGCGWGCTCSIIETDKATGDKVPYVRDGFINRHDNVSVPVDFGVPE
jgi:hypothetical protein